MPDNSLLRRLLRFLGLAPATPQPRRPRRGFRLEGLEDRLTPSATVTTDKPDYRPDETAVITAAGFQVGETVQFQVLHTDGRPNTDDAGNYLDAHAPWAVTDGGDGDLDGLANGSVLTSWAMDEDAGNSAFSLTAAGLSSGERAETTFTDAKPTITLTATDGSAAEAGTNTGTIRVSRGSDTTGNLDIQFTLATGSGRATVGSDFTFSSNVSLVSGNTYKVQIDNKSSTADIVITPIDDSAVEGSETVQLTLASQSNYDIGSPSSATVTIADNDADATAPTLNSFTRNTPASTSTNADSLVFRATFSEAVKDVDTTDFTVSGSTATITSVTAVSGSGNAQYDITVSGGNLANFNGSVGVNLATGQNIKDLANNALPSGEPATDQTYTVDNTPPLTTATLKNADNSTYTAGTWTKQSVTVSLAVSESGSGLASTTYTVGGGQAQSYSAPFTVTAEGDHTLTFYSTDTAGNVESTQTLHIKVDKTAPTLTFGSPSGTPGTNGWYTSDVSISYTTNDNLSGVASSSPASPVVLSSEGSSVSSSVTVTDNAGNSAGFSTGTFKIDKTAPETSLTGSTPPSLSNSRSATFTFQGSDDTSLVAGFEYRLDGGTWTAASNGSQSLSGLSDGQHTFEVRAVDGAGNRDATPASYTWTVDATAPATASVTTPSGGNIFRAANAPAGFSGSAADNTGGVGLNANTTTFTLQRNTDGDYWDGSAWQATAVNLATTHAATTGNTSVTWTSSAALPDWSAQPDAVYTVQAKATDKSGNSFTGTAVTFTLDNTAPVTVATPTGTQASNGWYTSAVSVALGATDANGVSATYYKIGGGSFQSYSTPISITSPGQHVVYFYSTDTAGNVETTQSLTVKIATDQTASTGYSRSGLIRTPGTTTYSQTLTITNKSTSSLSAGDGFQVVLSGLQQGNTLTSASFVTSSGASISLASYITTDASGNVVISIPTSQLSSLAAGQSFKLALKFNVTNTSQPLNYSAKLFSDLS